MTRARFLVVLVAVALVAGAALARNGIDFGTTKITSLSSGDRLKSDGQRQRVDGLARRRLGSGFGSGPEADLRLLQRLFDERVVARDQLFELQAMGVVLGDVMVEKLRLRWVSIDDDAGHSRALRFRETEHLFFPVTMISKRAKLGDPVNVQALFDKTAEHVAVLERRPRY
jgi:hypothetical protein